MARGWESKDVASRQEEALNEDRNPKETPLEMERRSRLHSLELDRKRLETELGNAKHPRHCELVKAALNHVLAEIDLLDG